MHRRRHRLFGCESVMLSANGARAGNAALCVGLLRLSACWAQSGQPEALFPRRAEQEPSASAGAAMPSRKRPAGAAGADAAANEPVGAGSKPP